MKKRKIVLFALLCLIIFAFVGCAKLNVNIIVKFESNGGTECESIVSDDINSIKIPTNPTREGYVFDGWYWDDGVWQKPFTINSILDLPLSDRMDIIVYAKWNKEGDNNPDDGKDDENPDDDDNTEEKKEYRTITFDGVQGYAGSRVVALGDALNDLPTLTRKGYTFDGWTTAGDDGKMIEAGYVVDFAEDTTLFAKWTANTYRVLFNAGDGEGSMSPQTFTYDNAQALAANAFTKAGYKFAGWEFNGENGKEVYDNEQVVNNLSAGEDIVLTAQWQGNEFTVDFDGNGATSLPVSSQQFIYAGNGSLQSINRNIYRKGYGFMGWQYGDRLINDTIPLDLIPDDGEHLTFTAVWQAITYKVSFSANATGEISGTMPELTLVYDEDYPIPACGFTRKGYVFAHWSCDGKILEGVAMRNLTDSADEVTVYAHWTPITYQLKYDGNGADSGEMASQTVTYDESFYLEPIGYAKNGYEFAYYQIESLSDIYYSGSYITKSLAYEQGAVVTVKAVWQPVYEGDGTEQAPYLIRTASEVQGLNVLFRKNAAATYSRNFVIRFDADIDMQGQTLVPFDEGYTSGGFNYKIDGGGHTLSNYVMNSAVNGKSGLITYNYGTIENLNISGAHLEINEHVGDVGILAGYNTGVINNCSVVRSQVSYSAARGFERSEIGGLVGEMARGSVKNCYFTGNITVKERDGSYLCVGGIAGYVGSALIISCYADAEIDVTTHENGNVGGIAGYMPGETSADSKIIYSFAVGTITERIDGATASAGGVVGSGATYSDCYHAVLVNIIVTSGETCAPTCTANAVEDAKLRNEQWIAEKLPTFTMQGWTLVNGNYPELGNAEDQEVIEISTKEQLMALSGGTLADNYALTADIDLGGANWKPAKNFGIFNGGGYTVSGFTVKTLSGNKAGFFAENYGTVENLILSDFTINITNFGAATIGAIAAKNYGLIAYSKTDGTIAAESQSAGLYVGGIAGKTDGASIVCCYAKVDITVTSYANSVYAGGIAATVNAGNVVNCYTTGIINGVTGGSVGNQAYLYGIAPAAQYSFSMCNFTTKDKTMRITLAAAGSTNYGCTTQKMNSLTASSGMYVKTPANFGNPEFLQKMGFGVYVSHEDLSDNVRNAWILENGNLPKLYFEV